jgi:hypothetical protein
MPKSFAIQMILMPELQVRNHLMSKQNSEDSKKETMYYYTYHHHLREKIPKSTHHGEGFTKWWKERLT